ncbi:MAG: AraC family transcriptional regulator [Gracilimonas sp.]|uniref:helix-turn-helix domain-containing protein n=1 Tax=Gracilimonas sp. TaxID=1974203 RepID=UPI001B062364|nr:helix-turn-helix domain-containing protein [Gracilimonas sp.]MBO6586768.1 AraC family transcriptional regulator [Gracilimonas sp.]MBO6615425.1 AraC family transcriptional regulator [Gracilimonas sp.]
MPDGSRIRQPQCFVFGQLTRKLEIEPSGDSGMFAVRFKPEGLQPISKLAAKEFQDSAVPLAEILGEEGMALESKILKASSIELRIDIIEQFLTDKFESFTVADSIVKETVSTIIESRGRQKINELPIDTVVSRRTLERRFAESVGINLKQLSKIIRLKTAVQKMINREYETLTELACDNGYYDQAHFIKEFKTYTGLTPRDFFEPTFSFTHLFYESD